MNKIYKVIRSKVKHQYVVVSELAHSNGKQSRTSRNSIRSRIAALVVCGAITAFGVYGTLPANSVFAAAAETVAGQYIAVAVDANNQGRYSIGDTRTFEDAQGKTHNYTWVNVDGKNYWVREGYTITIENGSRFTAYDKWGNPIAPDNTYIIDSQKSDSADSEGLISSSQVVIGDDSAHTTLTGNKLNSIDAGIYGGAVNTGGTQVPSSFNYYINDNGNGWKDVGEETSVSSMDNFKKVYKMADGTYNTDRRGKGTTVSTDNLYVIDGELGAFFNSNGSVYTGNVYGHNNEVLMTGVENGTYYSYWGTEINDPNTSLSEMTVGDLKKIVGGINDTIYTAQGDDIKQVSVQKSGDNGGTIGLIRRGDWNGTAYEKTDPVPGTITVTSTGGEGKDVAIQFSNDKGSFTVDAGSKVVANNGAGGTDLETISVNGQTFNVIGGAISGQIDSEGNVKIQQGNKVPVTIGKVSDWNVKSGQINGSTLTLTTENAYDGNPKTGTVTIEGVASTNYVDAKDALNVKYDSAEKTSVTLGGKTGTPVKLTNVANGTTTYDAVNFSQLEAVQNAENYVTSGSINNENGTITLNRVQGGDVTIEGLSQYVANKDEYATSAELNGSELTINRHLGEAIKVDLSQLTSGLSGTDYQVVANPVEGSDGVYSVSEDGTLKLTVKDLNNPNAETKEVSINGIAQKDYVDAKDALNVKYDSADKTSVTLGGKGSKTPVKLTNVANGTSTYDAVNFSQLEAVQNAEDYVTSGSIDNANGTITLNRVQGGDVTISGLQDYVNGKDSYVTAAKLEGNKLTITQNNQGKEFSIDLSGLTSGLSGTDYQLVANPINGSGGKYTVDDNGNLTLTVKDLNNPNAATKTITITGLAKKTDVAVIHDQYKDGEYTNLRDTKAQIWDETSGASDKKSSSIALGKDAFVSVQNGRKADAILFGSDTYTGGIAIGQDSKALNGTVNIGVKDYTGKMGDVIVGDPNNRDLDNGEYNTYTAMGVGETSVGSNSYISGSLSTNIGSYNVITTKYMNGGNPLDSAQNFGSITVGTLNSIESNSSDSSMLDTIFGKVSGVANSVVGMANKTQNSNGSLVFGTGNEITNSIDTIPTPSSVSGDVADVAENFRDSVSDRNKSNGGAVLAIGGGNKADYAQNSQLIGVQNEITGTSRDISKFNMINGYQNTITNGSNDTVIGTKNTVTNGDSNVVLGDNHTVQNADNNVILGSSDKVATQTASNTVVIGYNAQANSNNDVAIGSGSVANGAVKTAGYAGANPIGTVSVGSEGNERTITNVAAGRINEDSTDAVNGSQLYATNQNVTNLTTKVDAGWSLYSNGKEVKNVKPGNNLVNIDSGENVSITKNEDGNGITISADLKDLDVEDTNAVLYDNEGKTSVTLGGTGHEAVKLTNVAAGALTETSTDAVNGSQLFETNTKVDAGWSLYSNGKEVKNVKPGNNWISIDSGDNVSITKNEDGNGIKISADLKDLDVEDTNAVLYDDEGKTTVTLGGEGHEAVKLTNVAAGTVNATSTDAINGSQLYEVQQQAGKHTTVTVNGGMTAPEDGSYTHDEEGRLDGNLLLKKTDNNGQTEYDLKLNPDLTLQGEDGSTARVEIGGTNGTIMATKDPNSMTATTTIDGGNVYVGSSVSVGDKVVMTNKDITGLSNTTWDGTTDDVSRAATEGQLQAVSNEAGKHTTVTVNGGMTAPEDGSYTHDEEGRLDGNLLLKKTDNNGQTEYDLKLNPDLTLQGEDGSTARVEIGGTNGTIMATKDPNSMTATTTIDGGNVYVGSSVSVGDKVEITDKDITGLSNTSWNGTTDDESRAATEGQLKDVSDTVNAGWTATDSNGASIVVNPENGSTLNFAGDRNIEVKANEKDGSIDVSLDDDMVLGGKEGTSRVEIGGTNGTIMATKDPNSMAATTTIDGGNVYVGSSISVGDKVEITDKDITGLSNTEWNGTTTTPDRAATEGQLQQVSNDVNAGWIATDNNGSQVNITPDNNKLNFAGDENVTVTAANNEIKVALKDDIVLGDYLNGDDGVLIGGSSGTISATNSITVGEDQGLIIDGQKKEIQGLSNTTWNEKIANDAAVEGSTAASTAATQGQLQEVSKVANAGWTASDGTNSISVKPNETLTFVGDENLTVSADGTDKELKVSLNDDITLKGDSSSIELTGTKGTIQVNQETAEGTNFTNINGNVVSIGYTNSEGIENAIVIDGGKGTITGLSNTTWDDELAKQVANSEELQGTAATQGQLQQAVSAVATEAAKQHTTVSGDDNLTVTSKENTNGGTNYQVTLNDDITLGNPKAGNTEGERSFTINTTDPNGYVPESYKTGSGANFIEENGGFMLFATDTRGFGVFGVTAKGSAWAKDFKTYTTDIYGNNTQYSLNEIGDAVAQMSSYYNEENGKSYTVFSRYLNEAEKDNPFVTVDENATRDIPLALRDDGAVLIGATIKGEDFTDNGIRINGEIDDDGNNVATITGLENTTWTPPAPVATFANEGTETSRAATEAQLNDLYGTVVGYNVDTNGVNYGTVTLGGGRTSYDQDTHEGGTVLNNVAYASGKDGSEAVNVDYLNDAINNAVKDGGAISDSDRHLQEGTYHVNDQGKVELIVADEKGENQSTVTIDNIANKNDITNLDNKIDNTFNDLNDKINNIDNVETDVKGGNINEDGTISLKTENEDGTTTNVTLKGQLTDSGVVQEGTTFDKETGTLTITSQDKYSGETSSVTVEGIASTEVVGATTKEDLATAYKDADKDGNATTEYITDSESMVEADVALDHAIQDVAGTSYANDMVLSNRIDSVEKRLGNVEERIDKVGAMAAAIANLRTMGFDPEAPTEIAIGVGQYKSETGIAIGVFHYPNQDFMLSASLSSSGDELMGGIGATWKLGRKSAAERAKDEEARHLEQAEEMKELAQQEKVKAQAQRHAKLLAESQQASQKNA